jgi:ribosomal protein L37AE/L43A
VRTTIQHDSREFSIDRDIIDVSVLSSPDEHWLYTDPAGHQHYWTWNGQRGTYRSGVTAELPTLRWVVEEICDCYICQENGVDDYEIGHYECRQCGAHVTPAAKPRTEYIAGLTHYRIDGRSVSKDEFMAEARKAGLPGV